MLNDREIERAAAQLADYRRSDILARLLNQYAVLIDDYKRLKSDYEEERENREKYKQMAKDQERNPFVLVLVDGDGYVFNDSLLSKRAEGGANAAQMLNEEVRASLRRKGLEHCQVMMRVYANVFGLSKAVCKAGVAGVGGDSRSLSPFIASFNRAFGLTEFVDAGELKENADSKLRALLRLYADNTQCKHIFFAGCHDVGYISELTPFMGNSSKFTLIDTPGIRFHDEFTKLGMGIEEFRRVFRHAPLDGSSVPYRAPNASKPTPPVMLPPPPPAKKPPTTAPPAATNGKQSCFFYSIGKCRFGKSCKLAHVDPPADKTSRASPPSAKLPASPSPTGTTTDNDDTTQIGAPLDSPITSTSNPTPQNWSIPRHQIPLNANNHRVDPPPQATDPSTMALLKSRIDRRRVCNNFHLAGACDAGERCEYDHDPLPPECIPALEALARTQPCPRRGGCRLVGCTHGHVCHMADCKHRGGKAYCRIPWAAHAEDGGVVRYEVGVVRKKTPPKAGVGAGTAARADGSESGSASGRSSEKETETEKEGSGWNSNPGRVG